MLTIVQVPLTALGGTVQVETRNYFSAEETVREHLPSDSQRQRFACKYRNLSSKQLVLFEELAKEDSNQVAEGGFFSKFYKESKQTIAVLRPA